MWRTVWKNLSHSPQIEATNLSHPKDPGHPKDTCYTVTTYKSIWNEYLCQVLAMPKAIPGSMQTHWHRWVRSASCCTCGFSHRYTCDDLQVTHTRAQPYSRLVDAPVTIIQEYSWCILSSLHLSATSSCATQIIFKVYFHVFPWI